MLIAIIIWIGIQALILRMFTINDRLPARRGLQPGGGEHHVDTY